MKLKKCTNCKIYTFKQFCPKCNVEARNPVPPKYSPEDTYGRYRRLTKQTI